jgi:FkbM family methyltransferase
MPSIRRRIYRTLDRPGLRPLLGFGRSAEILVREHEACTVLPDQLGWTLRSRDGVLVGPEPTMSPPGQLQQEVIDAFCYGYLPKPADVVVDIGAGIGREAFVFATLVSATGIVHCIEAHPITFGFLTRMVALNSLGQVRCHNLAISDSPGFVAISSDEDLGRYYQNRILPSGAAETTIPATSIEQFCRSESLDRVDLLVMNIEGAERLAVKGMSAVVDRIQNVAIACHDFLADKGGDERLRTKAYVQEFLVEHGFETQDRPEEPRDWLRSFVYGAR